VDGHAVAYGELDLLSIDHLERFALFVVVLCRQGRTTLKDRSIVGIACRSYDQFGLKYPSRILVVRRLSLGVDEEQCDEAITIDVFGPDSALDPDVGMLKRD
jgi:hypothetical protein